MAVKENLDDGRGRRTQADRTAATKAALIAAARVLFAAKGFNTTAREEIVDAAGVTRGALYHHFGNKEALFREVVEVMERETLDSVMVAASKGKTASDRLRLGALAYLDAALDPAIQRIVLLDAPAVLGWQVRRDISDAYGLGLVRGAVEEVMNEGGIRRQPAEPLAHVLLAALHEAAMFVAQSDNQRMARKDVGITIERFLEGLA